MHGPERIFDVEVAFDDQGIIRSMKMRALDNVGAYAGRSPFQLGKPVGAIVGPYKIKSVQYQAIAVVTNKTVQEAVRAFGQSPTNYAIERTIDEVANKLGLDRLEVRRRNMIRARRVSLSHPERLDLRQRRLSHRHRQGAGARRLRRPDRRARPAARAAGMLAGIGIAACLEPSGGNSSFEPLLNPKVGTTTWMESCRISVDLVGSITATMHTTSAGQGHETLVGTVVGEVLEIDPGQACAWCGADSLEFAAEQQPGRQPHGDHARRRGVPRGEEAQGQADRHRRARSRRAGRAHRPIATATRSTPPRRDQKRTWAELVTIAHRHIHKLPPGMEPGLSVSHIMPVPTGGGAADRRRPRADVSLLLVRIPSDAGGDRSRSRQARDQALRHRPRLRHRDQSEDRARHDHGRHRPRHRRGALRGVRLQRRRPAGGAELHGLSAAVGARGAGGRDRRITRRRRRTPCSARRARAKAAISARRPRSRARSTTRCARSASSSTPFLSKWRGLAI